MSKRQSSGSDDPDETTTPYDEPTGQIPTSPRADRDSFFAKHAKQSAPVDDLDDLDPGEVETRSFAAPTAGSASTAKFDAADLPETSVSESADAPKAYGALPAASSDTPEFAPIDTDVFDNSDIDRDSFRLRNDSVSADDSVPAGDDPTTPVAVPPSRSEFVDEELAAAERKARRGTLDLGLLLLRVGVGALMVAHGLQKLFGWFDGPGLRGFEAMLVNEPNTAIGFNDSLAYPMAILAGLSETVGGAMLVLGLLTPIGASAVLGVMLVATAYKITLAGGFSFFAMTGGVEFELLLVLAAAVIILTGPGLYSLDFSRGWARRPMFGSLAWLLVGVGAAAAVWFLTNGTNPFESAGNPAG